MTKAALKIYDWLCGHKAVATAAILILCAAMAGLTLTTHYEEDIAKFMPQDSVTQRYQYVYERVSSPNRVAVLFTGRDSSRVPSADSLEMAMDAVGRSLEAVQGIEGLQTSVSDGRVASALAFVGSHIPYYLTGADYRHIDSLLAVPGYMDSRMEEVRQVVAMPMGAMSMQLFQCDPLGLFAPLTKRMNALTSGSQFTVVDGYVFSRDGSHALITFNSKYGPSETRQNAVLAASLDSIMGLARQAYPTIRVTAIGAPLISVTNATQIKRDSIMTISVAVVLIMLLLIVHYRRLSDILWIGASLLFGCMFAMAGVSLFQDSVSIIVLGIGSVIIGIAVNYPLHFLDHIREAADVRTALREIVAPLLIGNITTVAAFLCLVWLKTQAMRDLGLFGSLMLIGTILFVLVVLPVYVRKPKVAARTAAKDAGQQAATLRAPWGKRFGRVCFLAVLALTIVFGWLSLRTSFDSNLTHINYMTADQRADMDYVLSASNQADAYAVAEGRTFDEALAASERQQAELAGKGVAAHGMADYVPSKETQQARLRLWNDFLSRHPSLLADFRASCRRMDFSQEAFASFEGLLQKPLAVLPAAAFSPLAKAQAERYTIHDGGGWKLVSYLSPAERPAKPVPADYNPVEPLLKGVSQSATSYTFTLKDMGSQLANILNDSFNYVGFVCGFVVFFFLWLSFGRLELSLLSFLPLAVSWLWILGIMELFGVQFNIVNIILATFIFGQGDDYTIFITEGLIYEHATGRRRLASYSRSVLLSATLMFIGMGCLVFARHPALRSLGIVTVIGMATVVFMAYYLPTLIYRWVTTTGGRVRQVPLTLKRIGLSLFALLFFLALMYCWLIPYTWIFVHTRKMTEERRLWLHVLIQRVSRFIINHVPGVRFTMDNAAGETFSKPAVIISNHQSQLDLMCLMMLTPKVVFMTNDWVWNNPIYGYIIHHLEFYPVSDGIESNMPRLRDLYRRGYSICIFPEGTRSDDCSILPFHKGAFYLARELGSDILPVFLHGAGHVLPKTDFMLREGVIHMEIDRRIGVPTDVDDTVRGDRKLMQKVRHYYVSHYAELCARLEDEEYYKPFVRYQYMYKGPDIERRVNRSLDNPAAPDSGLGEKYLLRALAHPGETVSAVIADAEDFDIANNISIKPPNLIISREA